MTAAVEVLHWNPKVAVVNVPVLRRFRRPVNNFGDLLGPPVVRGTAARLGLDHRTATDAGRKTRLLAVGSILHFARDGDTVWGAGINGKIPTDRHVARLLDVRAVRGPRTRDILMRSGIHVPEVYGDPALLLPQLDARLRKWAAAPKYELTVMPNLNELAVWRDHPAFFSPTAPLARCLKRLARSRFVVASSLHAVIVAESLGIPARLVAPRAENLLKYEDYYLGTGRSTFAPSSSIAEGIKAGGEAPLSWDPQPLLDAFPRELWPERTPR